MNKDDLLSKLFREFTGNDPEKITVLPKSGSDRRYIRMTHNDFSLLGVWNPDRKENDAFVGFAGQFRSIGLRVPEVYNYLPEEMVYLAEDLGGIDLFNWVRDNGNSIAGSSKTEVMYRKILKELVRFQFEADRELDYDLAYPRKKFDRSSVMWDLNYFKYMFLKLSGTGFNEQLLENDFVKIADEIEKVGVEGFLYRDFQSRNIIIKDEEPSFIDFQGGRKGAPHYDVASLLLDPYVELDKQLHDRLLEHYLGLLDKDIFSNNKQFIDQYRVFGVVRLLQALGAYGFRGLHEKKPGFVESIPPAIRQLHRIFEAVEIRVDLPELASVAEKLFNEKRVF
jgi:aminoglycoside/choline kinase family phosphotransferase